MKINVVSILLALVFFSSVNAVDQQMIIIMNDGGEFKQVYSHLFASEEERPSGAMFVDLMYALADGNIPILVAPNTWNIFYQFSQLHDELLNLSVEEFKKKLNDETIQDSAIAKIKSHFKAFVNEAFSNFSYMKQNTVRVFSDIVSSRALVNELEDTSKWKNYIIKDKYNQNGHLILMVPMAYIKRIALGKGFSLDKDPLSSIDSILGLNLPEPLEKLSTFFLDRYLLDEYFLNAFQKLFIPTKVNEKESAGKADEWYFFMHGHGGPKDKEDSKSSASIAGLDSKNFVSLLKFLNNKLTTKFLAYSTCYAGGEHLFIPYEEHFSALTFNYTILSSTYAFSSTYEYATIFGHGQGPSPSIIVQLKTQKYYEFFERVAHTLRLDTKSKDGILKNLANIYMESFGKELLADDIHIPIIRFPNTEWFTLLNPDNKVFYFTKTMLDVVRAEGKKIVISPDKSVVQLPTERYLGQTLTATFEPWIEIIPTVSLQSKHKLAKRRTDDAKIFISLAPYSINYAFNAIDASTYLFDSIMRAFLASCLQGYKRIFYIKTLTFFTGGGFQGPRINNRPLFPLNTVMAINNVWIGINRKQGEERVNTVYFEYNGKQYTYTMSVNDSTRYRFDILWAQLDLKQAKLNRHREYKFKNHKSLKPLINVLTKQKNQKEQS